MRTYLGLYWFIYWGAVKYSTVSAFAYKLPTYLEICANCSTPVICRPPQYKIMQMSIWILIYWQSDKSHPVIQVGLVPFLWIRPWFWISEPWAPLHQCSSPGMWYCTSRSSVVPIMTIMNRLQVLQEPKLNRCFEHCTIPCYLSSEIPPDREWVCDLPAEVIYIQEAVVCCL